MPPKQTNNYNALKNSTNIHNSNNNSIHNPTSKLPHDPTLDWPNNYFDNAKMLPSSMQKFNSNISSLTYDLTNSLRYQQEQQDLMNALRLKHVGFSFPSSMMIIIIYYYYYLLLLLLLLLLLFSIMNIEMKMNEILLSYMDNCKCCYTL